jgi:hypothetical protein
MSDFTGHWKPTPELRWVRQEFNSSNLVLQQRWQGYYYQAVSYGMNAPGQTVEIEYGPASEWRDVPTSENR